MFAFYGKISWRRNLVIFLLIFLLFYVLYKEAQLSFWRAHLEIDVWDYYQTMQTFFKNFSFFYLKGNEILPGSLLFLFTPFLFIRENATYALFLKTFNFINLGIIFILLVFFQKKMSFFNFLLYLLILLAYGPIILFRIEPWITLLLIFSLLLWQKKKFALSLFFLGLATSGKLYPVFLLPYYLYLIIFEKKSFFYFFENLAFYLGGLLFPVFLYLLLGGTLKQVLASLSFHLEKPLSIESFWGTIYTFWFFVFKGKLPELLGVYGLWGLKIELGKMTQFFLNNLSFLPLLFSYFFVFFRQGEKKFQAAVLYLLVLSSLVFAKNLHPQYLFWFISFLSFLKAKKKALFSFYLLFFLIFLISLITQYIYPLHYTQYLVNFYGKGEKIGLFFLLLLRNFLILFLFVLSFKKILWDKKIS